MAGSACPGPGHPAELCAPTDDLARRLRDALNPFIGSHGATAILAVSGGPDSLALMIAASLAASAVGASGFRVQVVTVDHRLRPESAAEAALVARYAAALGFSHRTVAWTGAKPASGIPAAARAARYRLLTQAAEETGAAVVITAHHQDDQVETHLLAAARGAGSIGLAGMRERRALTPGVTLLRPFLDVPKARLREAVAAANLTAIEDPSNADRRYARARLRRDLAEGRHDRAVILRQIATHQDRRRQLEVGLAEAIGALRGRGKLSVGTDGVVRIDREAFSALETDLQFLFLRRAVQASAGADYPPDASSLVRLAARLAGRAAVSGASLGGAVIRAGSTICFAREYGRSGLAAIELPAGARRVVFDGRFDIDLAGGEPGRLIAFGLLGRGNHLQRTLPVVLKGDGHLLAAHPNLLEKLGDRTAALRLRERVSWRLQADLPPA
ncbi:tRNA lysidine(34) synthetase TilS [Mangrovicella endophytica]|uniref:tRNA lysidine(34) synthetase TilS n=1 Tax=Mangrovicella endophytica TaxID=2066697 RepID=UPI000C9EA16A|nr:tRNA lysidine(34) synthetase TilS [Mangrovicella endophytica]